MDLQRSLRQKSWEEIGKSKDCEEKLTMAHAQMMVLETRNKDLKDEVLRLKLDQERDKRTQAEVFFKTNMLTLGWGVWGA